MKGYLFLLTIVLPITNAAVKDGGLRQAPDDPERPFLKMVVSYADTMLEKGRDRWGAVHSPLFISALNRKTHDIFGWNVQENAKLPSLMSIDMAQDERMFDAANPARDAGLYSTLYLLSKVTGDAKYAGAADEALRYFLTHCQDQRTGLLAWGEHMGWHLPTDTWHTPSPNGRIHELWIPVWPHYERCYGLGEASVAALQRFAQGMWRWQIDDHERGLWNRHAFLDSKRVSRQGQEYPRLVGEMCHVWSLAGSKSSDPAFKAEMVKAVEVVVNSSLRRSKPNGALPFGTAPHLTNYYNLSSNMVMLHGLQRTVGRVPPPTAERVQALMNNADRFILEVLPHDLGNRGKGFYSFCYADNLAPGDPRHPAKNISPYSDLWDGNTNSTAVVARMMIDRYRLTNIAGFKRLAVAAADLYLAGNPPRYDKSPGIQVFPLHVAAAIQLLLEVHELSGDLRYLKRAAFLGHEARVLFFDDISPLPTVSSDPRPKHAELYDTFTYGDDLMFALLKLHLALKTKVGSDFK